MLGATEEQLAQERAKLETLGGYRQAADEFGVYEENREALTVFLDCFAEWEQLGGKPAAISRQALYSSMSMLDVADQRDCLFRVQIMEAYVRRYFAETPG